MNTLKLIGRKSELFSPDVQEFGEELKGLVRGGRFLVIGGAGSIGQAIVREIFKRRPKLLHVIDINENNLVELVRDLRSSIGYIDGEFATFCIDCGDEEFESFMQSGKKYDYVLNLSALKHVRSEKDPYTLMRLIKVNILNTLKISKLAHYTGAKKYFCVSTDKAANPVNMMGASKRIMEMYLMRESNEIPISMARFANVAFSDGSLLHGFNQRFEKWQPITAPNDVKRYFITPQESGELCLISCLLGGNGDTLFPKLNEELHLSKFSDIAERFVEMRGYTPFICASENDARARCHTLINNKLWPCYFFKSDTTGEKDFEEFYTKDEELELEKFQNIGIIKNQINYNDSKLDIFLEKIHSLRAEKKWNKEMIVEIFNDMIPNFEYKDNGKYLDGKM